MKVSNLKAVRAQELRAVMHVLTRDNERLEEERNKLKMTIRKLARQLGPKVNVASIIDEDYLYDDGDGAKATKQDKEEGERRKEQAKQPDRNKEQDGKQTQQLEGVLKKRNEQLMQLCLEFENKNKLLEKGLKEIHAEIVSINSGESRKDTGGKGEQNSGSSVLVFILLFNKQN